MLVKYVRITIVFARKKFYRLAVCNPVCLNGGNCTAPDTCTCKLSQS